jgi:hypothetical protein
MRNLMLFVGLSGSLACVHGPTPRPAAPTLAGAHSRTFSPAEADGIFPEVPVGLDEQGVSLASVNETRLMVLRCAHDGTVLWRFEAPAEEWGNDGRRYQASVQALTPGPAPVIAVRAAPETLMRTQTEQRTPATKSTTLVLQLDEKGALTWLKPMPDVLMSVDVVHLADGTIILAGIESSKKETVTVRALDAAGSELWFRDFVFQSGSGITQPKLEVLDDGVRLTLGTLNRLALGQEQWQCAVDHACYFSVKLDKRGGRTPPVVTTVDRPDVLLTTPAITVAGNALWATSVTADGSGRLAPYRYGASGSFLPPRPFNPLNEKLSRRPTLDDEVLVTRAPGGASLRSGDGHEREVDLALPAGSDVLGADCLGRSCVVASRRQRVVSLTWIQAKE